MWPQGPTVPVSPPDLPSQTSYPGSPGTASAHTPSCLDCPHYRLIRTTKWIRAACQCPAFGARACQSQARSPHPPAPHPH